MYADNMSGGGYNFSIKRSEAQIIRDLDCHPKNGGLFGDHLLISTTKGVEKEAVRQRAIEAARQAIPIELSKREKRIIENLESKLKNV